MHPYLRDLLQPARALSLMRTFECDIVKPIMVSGEDVQLSNDFDSLVSFVAVVYGSAQTITRR